MPPPQDQAHSTCKGAWNRELVARGESERREKSGTASQFASG